MGEAGLTFSKSQNLCNFANMQYMAYYGIKGVPGFNKLSAQLIVPLH